jgi:hypothetical protein
MLMRFYGATALRAGDFARYLGASGGIAATDMVRAADACGYDAQVLSGAASTLCDMTSHGSPVIVLVDGSARLLHYVVVVGATDHAVVYHDPARRPGISQSMQEFEQRWAASGHWMLRLTPRTQQASVPRSIRLVSAPVDSTGAWLERAASAFRRGRFAGARDAAERAIAQDPGRESAWHVLGASHYMLDEPDSALAAWNHVDAPTLDLVRVQGLERTRHQVIADAMHLEDDELLTTRSLALARRRVAEVPSLSATRVDYRPVATGRADVDVALKERSLWPHSASQLGVVGVRVITERTIRATISSPTGGGETIEASYRWWENRPRAELALTTPELFGWQGKTRIAMADEVQTYAGANAAIADSPGAISTGRVVETTREGTVTRSQWITPAWMFDASAGYHRIRERGQYASLGSGLTWAAAHDACRARAGALVWDRVDDGESLHARLDITADQRAALSSIIQLESRAGWSVVDAAAPRSLWPGAGTGPGRDGLLRAHPLLSGGVITGSAFAPALVTVGTEATRWMVADVLGAAVFLDGAVPFGTSQTSRLILDAGIGARIHPPGEHGYVRVDIAAGLTETARAFSVAWQSGD